MDIATLIGIVVGFAMVIFGIISSGGVSAITGSFIDYPSIIITIGGSLASLMTSYTMAEFIGGFKSIGIAFKDPKLDHGAVIKQIIDLS